VIENRLKVATSRVDPCAGPCQTCTAEENRRMTCGSHVMREGREEGRSNPAFMVIALTALSREKNARRKQTNESSFIFATFLSGLFSHLSFYVARLVNFHLS
jgi:hypothetical protein